MIRSRPFTVPGPSPLPGPGWGSPDDAACRLEENELREAINGFLAKLPEEQRNLFLRRYWYLDSISDIARRFACSESKVKTTLLRCRKRLWEYLEEGGYSL